MARHNHHRRRPQPRWRGAFELLLVSGSAAALAAACSLDFNSFTYPEQVVTSSTSSSGAGGSGGTGGLFTSSSSSGAGGSGAIGGMGGTGGAGGMGAAGGMGGMGGCGTPTDCPAPMSDCQDATCNNNTCGFADKPFGDPCASMSGDICDGQGSCISCQTTPTAAAGAAMCPIECSNCNDTDTNGMPDECVFDCTGPGMDICPGVMNCPAGFSCSVICDQDNCSNFTVNCPAGEACAVSCDGAQMGTGACAGITINCDQSTTCDLSCANNGCNNSSTMLCGSGKCTGTCPDNNAEGTLACGGSCWCDPDGAPNNSCNSQ